MLTTFFPPLGDEARKESNNDCHARNLESFGFDS